MKIQDNQNIKVLNYQTSPVTAKTSNREYLFDGAIDGVPSVFYMSFRDIEYINSRSSVFRTGLLVFDQEQQNEIYTALNIPNWEEIVLFEEIIEDMILSPTEDNLKKIVAIKDIAVFERIRGKLVFFINQGTHDISNKVTDVINQRFKEINSGVSKSKIIFKKEVKQVPIENEEVKQLKEQLAQMQEMMSKMMETKPSIVNNQEDNTEISDSPSGNATIVETNTKKSAGRPTKK